MLATRRLFGIVLIGAVLTSATVAAQQTMIFVRHAERADGGAGAQTGAMSNAPADPSLSAAGEARAARLATILVDAGIKAIFTTEFKRTQETAKLLASKLGISIQVVPSKDTATLVSKIKAAHSRDTVLVIGHSNTIPDLIRAFGGPEVKIADDDYSGIYLLSPATGALTVIRF